MAEIKRKIVVKDFFNPNDHLYEDELGFREFNKEEARSVITREIFEYYICLVHLQMVFYHLDVGKAESHDDFGHNDYGDDS